MSATLSAVIGIPASVAVDGAEAGLTKGKNADLPKAAEQFEALMMHQILESARGTSGSWFGTGEDDEDQASAQAMEIAQEQFAGALAAKGGFGLAKLIVSRLIPAGQPTFQSGTDAIQKRTQ